MIRPQLAGFEVIGDIMNIELHKLEELACNIGLTLRALFGAAPNVGQTSPEQLREMLNSSALMSLSTRRASILTIERAAVMNARSISYLPSAQLSSVCASLPPRVR